jgi:hypothetical protein
MTDRPPRIKPDEDFADYSARRAEWFNDNKTPVREVVVERDAKVVVKRVIIETPSAERIVHVKDESDAAELARLREMEKRMEALAARQAAPGPNIPPAIKALMDDNLSDAENIARLRGRWIALTSQHMAEAQKSTALPPLTDVEKVELATLNNWDKLRG